MLLEALTPLQVKADGKQFALKPGQLIDLSPDRAARHLERAPGKVRAVSTDAILAVHPGSRVTWQSPLFCLVTGRVTGVCVNGFLEVQHPLAEQSTTIPLSWVLRQADLSHLVAARLEK